MVHHQLVPGNTHY